MSNPYFQFKQFTIWHDKCAMKVSTDGVLLGAWTDVQDASRILDAGTGSGLIAIMLAQRCHPNAHICAVEIDKDAAAQARENVHRSPWKNRIEIVEKDFREYAPAKKFDLIVSNPPYFANSLACPDVQRNMARHDTSLSYEELLNKVDELLTENGKFNVVIPTDSVSAFTDTASIGFSLYPLKQVDVTTKAGKRPKRTLICFSRRYCPCNTKELVIEAPGPRYSDEYIRLTSPYYLNVNAE